MMCHVVLVQDGLNRGSHMEYGVIKRYDNYLKTSGEINYFI